MISELSPFCDLICETVKLYLRAITDNVSPLLTVYVVVVSVLEEPDELDELDELFDEFEAALLVTFSTSPG